MRPHRLTLVLGTSLLALVLVSPLAAAQTTPSFVPSPRFSDELVESALARCGGQEVLRLLSKGGEAQVARATALLLAKEASLEKGESPEKAAELWSSCEALAEVAAGSGHKEVAERYLGIVVERAHSEAPGALRDLLELLGERGDELRRSRLVESAMHRHPDSAPTIVIAYFDQLFLEGRYEQALGLYSLNSEASGEMKEAFGGREAELDFLRKAYARAINIVDERMDPADLDEAATLALIKGVALFAQKPPPQDVSLVDVRESRCPGYIWFPKMGKCLFGVCVGDTIATREAVERKLKGERLSLVDSERDDMDGETLFFEDRDRALSVVVRTAQGKVLLVQASSPRPVSIPDYLLDLGDPLRKAIAYYRAPSRVVLLGPASYGAVSEDAARSKSPIFHIGWCGGFSYLVNRGRIVSILLTAG